MGPGYYVIAILGCGDGSVACTPVATVPTHFATEESCSAAAPAALVDNSDLDFPVLVAQCRGVTRPAAAADGEPPSIPSGAMRG